MKWEPRGQGAAMISAAIKRWLGVALEPDPPEPEERPFAALEKAFVLRVARGEVKVQAVARCPVTNTVFASADSVVDLPLTATCAWCAVDHDVDLSVLHIEPVGYHGTLPVSEASRSAQSAAQRSNSQVGDPNPLGGRPR